MHELNRLDKLLQLDLVEPISSLKPADLAHLVRRHGTQRSTRLVLGYVAQHSRRELAPTRAPQQWLDQWGAHDPDRTANPWYQMERVGADAHAQAWESWRTSRDLWAEVLFQQLYAS